MNNKEYRYSNIQLRADNESRRIEGLAVVFESWSEDLGFREIIKSGAITEDVIKNSDIVATYNHIDSNLLARSKYGEGTLELTIEPDGLHVAFDAPNTQLGNDILFHLRAGNISSMSFAFTIPDEEGAQQWYEEDGVLYRVINKIDKLYDVSCVNYPAYSDTSVFARSIELADEARTNIQKRNMDKEQEYLDKIAELEAKIKELEEKEMPAEEPKKEEPACETKECPAETPAEEPKEEKEMPAEEPKKEEPAFETKECPAKDEYDDKNIERNIKMNSLLKNFRKAAAGETVEMRATTVSTSGNTVKTEVENILAPLYAEGLIGKLGMKVYPSLTDNKAFPLMGKPTATFIGETSESGAPTSDVSVTAQTLKPYIVKALVPVSNKMLIQDNVNFESTLRDTMVEALRDKIETLMFSSDAENSNGEHPAGLLNGVDSNGVISDFSGLTAIEAKLEGYEFNDFKYAVAPNAKSLLRTLPKGQNAGAGMVYANNEIDGVPAVSNTHVGTNNIIVGDWKNVAVGLWDTIQIEVVSDSTLAAKDMKLFVVTMYFDFKKVRPNCVAYATIA